MTTVVKLEVSSGLRTQFVTKLVTTCLNQSHRHKLQKVISRHTNTVILVVLMYTTTRKGNCPNDGLSGGFGEKYPKTVVLTRMIRIRIANLFSIVRHENSESYFLVGIQRYTNHLFHINTFVFTFLQLSISPSRKTFHVMFTHE